MLMTRVHVPTDSIVRSFEVYQRNNWAITNDGVPTGSLERRAGQRGTLLVSRVRYLQLSISALSANLDH